MSNAFQNPLSLGGRLLLALLFLPAGLTKIGGFAERDVQTLSGGDRHRG